jgi:Tc5 transposase DNA-binding domain.
MVSSKIVRDLYKQQTFKEPTLMQLDRVLYEWFIAVCSKGKLVTGPMIIKKTKSFNEEMEIIDRCTSPKGSNK